MHAEGLILPELKLGRDQAIAAPVFRTRNIVIVAINGTDFCHALIEHVAIVEGTRLIRGDRRNPGLWRALLEIGVGLLRRRLFDPATDSDLSP